MSGMVFISKPRQSHSTSQQQHIVLSYVQTIAITIAAYHNSYWAYLGKLQGKDITHSEEFIWWRFYGGLYDPLFTIWDSANENTN